MKILTIAVDFDGTIAEEDYPAIGNPIPGAIETINTLHEMGHIIIINSCRAGEHEEKMKNFLYLNGVKHHYVNENPEWRVKLYGIDCRKIGADLYIDDRNIFTREINWPEIYAEIMSRCIEPGDQVPEIFEAAEEAVIIT